MRRGGQKKGKIKNVVTFDKVSERVVTAKLVSILGEETVKGKSLELKTEILLEWYLDRMGEAKKAGDEEAFGACQTCGGPAEVADPEEVCHFCGTPFDEEEPPVDVDKIDVVAHAEELDAAVERVRVVIADSSKNMWRLGRELLGIFDNKLYKKRLAEDGRALYASWDQFTEAELGFSGPRARSFMDVAREFSEEDVVRLGVEKLRAIRRLPPNRRPEFISKAPELTTRALANEVARVSNYRTPPVNHQAPREELDDVGGDEQPAPPPVATGRAAALKKGTEAAKEARDKKKQVRQAEVDAGKGVTAIFQLGEYDIPLEPEGDDDFKAVETLVNGAVITYMIFPAGKKPFMRVKIARE